MVIDETPGRSWLVSASETLKGSSGVGADRSRSNRLTSSLVGQNLVPFEVTRYMATSLRFRNGFLAQELGSRGATSASRNMPDDQNETAFTLFFHIRNDEGEVVASKLFSMWRSSHTTLHTRVVWPGFLHPTGRHRAVHHGAQFFGERESLTGVTAVPGWYGRQDGTTVVDQSAERAPTLHQKSSDLT